MKAIILAAGESKRLMPLTKDKPKCLLKIRDKSILKHQLNNLQANGISDIIIVTGYYADKIKNEAGNEIKYIHNPIYDKTNSLYSLWLAREELSDGFILLNSDIIFQSQVLQKLIDSNYSDAILVDFNKKLKNGEMNVKVNNKKVVEISKTLFAKEADGESVQILKLGKEGAKRFFEEVDLLILKGIVDVFPPYALNKLVKHYPVYAVDVWNSQWIEIDTLEDLKGARESLNRDYKRL
ncbi:phosphocholine cytidylyltransferase family protein [candidate division WOR-3 bacterium]|nr:phosphocholine cytidylyltransferase family protein [candidate division WOR-3 bacterium]